MLGLGSGSSDLHLMNGIIVAVYSEESEIKHLGCHRRILVLWADITSALVLECDCGLMAPLDIGL